MKADALFGGLLIIVVIAVAAYALLWPRDLGGGALCGCYREAYRLAQTGASVSSAEYKTGFVRCSAERPEQGGAYWTAGWKAGRSGGRSGRQCRV